MSVYRDNHATDEELKSAASILVDNRRKKDASFGLMGVLMLAADDVKALMGEDFSPYCIYDTSRDTRPSHADVFQRAHGVDETIRQDRRQKLFASINSGFVTIAGFRSGLLMPWKAANAP